MNWKPKSDNNDIYIGKFTRIYCSDNTEREGKLVYIRESKAMKGLYSVCVENLSGYPTHNTVSDSIIKSVKVRMFDITDALKESQKQIVKEVSRKYMCDDASYEINKYIEPYVEV